MIQMMKPLGRAVILFAVLSVCVGCGDLGNRSPVKRDVTEPFNEAVYDSLDKLLGKYVDKKGSVDFLEWRKSSPDLLELKQTYLKIILTDSRLIPGSKKKAYYINAYNVIVLWLVLWKYGSTASGTNVPDGKSIQNLAKPGQDALDVFKWRLGADVLSLKEIRDKFLRSTGDPRIHFALTNASKGGPPLYGAAFRDSDLDKVLDNLAIRFVNADTSSTPQTQIDIQKNTIMTSQLLNWYRSDFEATYGGLTRFFAAYIDKTKFDPVKIKSYTVNFSKFDWHLDEPYDDLKPPPPPPDENFFDSFIGTVGKFVKYLRCTVFGGGSKLCDRTVVDPSREFNETQDSEE